MSGPFRIICLFSSLNRKGKAFDALLLLLALLVCTSSCKRNTFYPKPIAYPRIDYPPASYVTYKDEDLPVAFQYPAFCSISESGKTLKTKGITLLFRSFNAGLYLSLSKTNKQGLSKSLYLFEQAVSNQTPPECTMLKIAYEQDAKHNEGYLYLTQGFSPAPVQFFVHDAEGHLMTGSLIFNQVINPDSIPEVLSGMKRDVQHLIETLEFR